MRINEDYIDGFKDEEVIQHEREMISDPTPADIWYENCKSEGYTLIIAPTTRFVYGLKKTNIEKLVRHIRLILNTVCIKISTTQISTVNPLSVKEYEHIGVVQEKPEIFDSRFLGEFVIKTAVKLRTDNVDRLLRMFASLSTLVVENSNMAMLRFAMLKDRQWTANYELPGFMEKVDIPLEVSVDIQALLYGTRQGRTIVQREYGKSSTKLAKLSLIVKLLTNLVPDKMTDQELMKKIYAWIQ